MESRKEDKFDLIFELLWTKPCGVTIQMKPLQQDFHGNKLSLSAPTPKRPKVGMSYGKRRALGRKGARAKGARECHRCEEVGGGTN